MVPQFSFPACVKLWCGCWEVMDDTEVLTTPPLAWHLGLCHSVVQLGIPSSLLHVEDVRPGSLHGLKAGEALPCGEFNLP